MKIKSIIFKEFAVFTVACLLCISCKKETTTVKTSVNDTVAQSTVASDELLVNDEVDQAVDDAVSGICECKSTSGGAALNPTTVLGAVIDTSQVDSGIVNVFYYGKERDTSKSRSGSVEIKLPVVNKKVVPWTTPGVSATITYTAYEVFYSNNTTLWFQGSFTITNFSGGLLKNLSPVDSLVEKVRGPISYTSNDNGAILTLYTWNLHRTRILKVTGSNAVTVTTLGDTSMNGLSNISNWGTDRLNQSYYTTIAVPVFQNTTGSTYYNPLSGSKIIKGIPEPITITFGVNQQGAVTSGTPYGYLLNWTNASGAQKDVVSY